MKIKKATLAGFQVFEEPTEIALEWLSSDEGQEFMTEVDLSVKGSARAGLDSVIVDTLCCPSKGIINPLDISEAFKILGFKIKINGSTIELGWD